MNPVSFSSIVVGVPWGRFIIIFSFVLNIFCIWSSSFFVGFHASDPYVRIGMMLASMHCQIAFLLIPLNSLSPVSANDWLPLFWILCVLSVPQGCLSCCIFLLGICIWVPLSRLCYLGWSCFLGLVLFSLPCILLLQILYDTFCDVFCDVHHFLSGCCVWGTRHTSIAGCSDGFPVLFVGLCCSFLILWLFCLLGLHILLPTSLLLVQCCLWYFFNFSC